MWNVKVRRKARNYLLALSRPMRERIECIIDEFEKTPFPKGYDIKRLEGRPGFRLRTGKYRIIYSVYEKIVTVEVVKIDSRGDVYK